MRNQQLGVKALQNVIAEPSVLHTDAVAESRKYSATRDATTLILVRTKTYNYSLIIKLYFNLIKLIF